MTNVKEIEGFLAQAKKEHTALDKKILKCEERLDLLRLARDDNENLQSFLQGEINSKS